MDFDFDKWAELAKNDPQSFEKQRAKVIKDFISSFPPEKQKKLWEFQLLIDAERQISKTPLEACQKLTQMMIDGVCRKGGLIELNAQLEKIRLELRLSLANLVQVKNHFLKERRGENDRHSKSTERDFRKT